MKTSELTGVALDWAVAKCEGCDWLFEDMDKGSPPGAAYSTDWGLAGPIIEREHINVVSLYGSTWGATKYPVEDGIFQGAGPTPLVAAMRCHVDDWFGDEIELPEGLK